MPLVSIIIPVYNRGVLVRTAIDSVVAQTYRPLEIILVDDGSTDDTPRVLEEIRGTATVPITTVRQNNAGPGVAREAGRQLARGEFIQYLDSDDRLLPDKLSVQVAALNAHPDCGIAYGKTRLVDENGTILRAPYKKSGEKKEYLFPELLVDRWWNTHTPLYRKSVCDIVGPWPSNRMSEDWQYDARFGALRTRLVFCDQFVSEHVKHSGDRLTAGPLSHQKLCDIAALMPVLLQSALEAGVTQETAEMKHFSRWAFSLARQLGVQRESARAKECLQIAQQAGNGFLSTVEIIACRTLASLIGWKCTQRAVDLALRLRGREYGHQTLPPSWG